MVFVFGSWVFVEGGLPLEMRPPTGFPDPGRLLDPLLFSVSLWALSLARKHAALRGGALLLQQRTARNQKSWVKQASESISWRADVDKGGRDDDWIQSSRKKNRGLLGIAGHREWELQTGANEKGFNWERRRSTWEFLRQGYIKRDQGTEEGGILGLLGNMNLNKDESPSCAEMMNQRRKSKEFSAGKM